MKNKIKLMLMIVLSMTILTACGGDSPTKVVDSYFKELKSGKNTQAANHLFANVENKEDKGDKKDSKMDKNTEEAVKLYLSKLDAKVLSEKIDGDKATVEVEVKGLNFAQLMVEVIQDNLANVFGGEQPTDDQLNAQLLEKVKNGKPQTRKGKINLTKSDKGWQIKQDENLTSLVLGGME
ncbi:DUF4878 domain-containing protein [Paraclostridium sordellii]|uniref:Putative lipoprotein n=1 Tax=Paraclostridium sordellii TaxID=1505 RepID=A0A0C7R199_PARSO|nr:DUF4878 domain-containing protein [Paeniclostridium sordellii]QYE99129.1 DUF4878 domain-containing protein [Paeniclostridium sordellii]CEN77921.1 putative lipoprotein [[Clostridium] sordellii] [Paeniclostridium sordellii]CEQ03008.1 putative lipoprotein [[Clostridium] sordellii] [Paeniclostridium sordellii]